MRKTQMREITNSKKLPVVSDESDESMINSIWFQLCSYSICNGAQLALGNGKPRNSREADNDQFLLIFRIPYCPFCYYHRMTFST